MRSFRQLGLCAILLSALLSALPRANCQTDTATISGRAFDDTGALIPNARIDLKDAERNTTRTTTTNKQGVYLFANVKPGQYMMQVVAGGFKTIDLVSLTLNAQDDIEQNFKLEVGSNVESVTVEAKNISVDVSGAVTTVVDQQLVNNLPLNGRSFQTLFQLTPGVVIATTDYQSQGQFSVNGQRTASNYFMVDGASANAGIATGVSPNQSMNGSMPAFGVTGGTNTLVSADAVQEFAIQTSTYAPEFGRTPGAQVSIITKSGTNSFHGTVFDYFRNEALDANDWFANHDNLPRAPERQNDFGGTFGGPVIKDKTFFFVSYEGLRLQQPTTQQTDVPSLASRNAAPAQIQPILNSFPLPNGADEGNGLAPANYAYSNPSTLDAVSARIDHHLNTRQSFFVRYNYAPSQMTTRGSFSSLSEIFHMNTGLQTLTAGSTSTITSHLVNDLRFNWTDSTGGSYSTEDNFHGAVPFPFSDYAPSGINTANGVLDFEPDLTGINVATRIGNNASNQEYQLNLVDTLAWQRTNHFFKFGVDYRRITAHYNPVGYFQEVNFNTVANAIALQPSFIETLGDDSVNATFPNWSLYAQDTWNGIRRLTLTYGLRWDYDPTPSMQAANGLQATTAVGLPNLAAVTLAPAGQPIYSVSKPNFAPRVGFAYQLRSSQKYLTVTRGGFGVFYDLVGGQVGNLVGFYPFLTTNVATNLVFPVAAADAAPPAFPTAPLHSKIAAFPNTYRLPYTYQWNLSVEQALGNAQSLTIGYLGAAGHRLLRTEFYLASVLPPAFRQISYNANDGYSNYDAMQITFKRRTTRTLDLLANYTYSHSLDNASNEGNFIPPGQFVSPTLDYASSDFDIRQVATIGADWRIPTYSDQKVAKTVLSNWSLDPVMTFRSSPPVNVTLSRNLGFGSYGFRPDLVPGTPLYLSTPGAPGGQTLNPAAFVASPTARQGTLGRNALRGFPLTQVDLALGRTFPLTERVNAKFSFEAFNILNHPNFSPESSRVGSVTSTGQFLPQNGFGVSTSMLNNGLLGAGPGGGAGFSPLYQIGGPRSLQAALRLEF